MNKFVYVNELGEFVESDELRSSSPGYVLTYNINGEESIYVLEEKSTIMLDGNNYIVAGITIPKDKLKILSIDENIASLAGIMSKGIPDEKIKFKDISSRLPDPYEEKLQPLTRVVCAMIQMDGKKIPYTKTDRQRLATLLRNVRNMADKDKDISITLAVELLEFYGLDVNNLFNPKYLVGK